MVDILDAVSIPIQDELNFTGTTRAARPSISRAKVTGYLKEIRFKDGQRVKKGDLLFVIERDPFQRELEARQADLKRAAGRTDPGPSQRAAHRQTANGERDDAAAARCRGGREGDL